MANLFPAGALEVNPGNALAANMTVGLVPRSGNIIRDIVSMTDLTISQGSVPYTYDADGWLGVGGGNMQFQLSGSGFINFAFARSIVVVGTFNDLAAGNPTNQHWMRAFEGASAAGVNLGIPEYGGLFKFVDPFVFSDSTYTSWTSNSADGGMAPGDQVSMLYRLTSGGPQTNDVIVNTGSVQGINGASINLSTGQCGTLQTGPFGDNCKLRCLFIFNKIISNAEFSALVADLGSTARVISGGGADVTAPTLNGDPTIGVRTTTSIAVQWVAGTDAVGVTAAEISKDDGATWIAASSVIGHTLTGLTPGQSYQIRYRLKDAALNTSANSAAVTGTALSGAITVFARGSMVWPAGLSSPDYPTAGDQIRGMVFRGWHGGITSGTAPTADYTTAAAVTVAIQTVTASGYTWQAQLSNAWSVGEKGFLDFSNRHGSQAISPTTHYHAGGEFTAAT